MHSVISLAWNIKHFGCTLDYTKFSGIFVCDSLENINCFENLTIPILSLVILFWNRIGTIEKWQNALTFEDLIN